MNKYWALLGVCVAVPVLAESVDPAQMKVYGPENKKTLYVFTSPACPHCSTYHDKILPTLKKEIADKGIAQIKLVEMATDHRSLKVAQLGRCMTMPQYEKYMADIYRHQAEWAYGNNYEALIKGYAANAGLEAKRIGECWDNAELGVTITNQWQNPAQKYRVTGMPTTVLTQGIKKQTYVGADKRIIDQIKDDVKSK